MNKTFQPILLALTICISFELHSLDLLTPAQVDAFHRDGFLLIDDFVPSEECDWLRDRALELVRQQGPTAARQVFTCDNSKSRDALFLESSSKICFFFEPKAFDAEGNLKVDIDKAINKIGHAMHDLDPVFCFFSRLPQVQNLVYDLGIENPLLMQSMYIFKQPYIGGEVTCHQDGTFLYTEPDTTLGLWFAIEDATLENGCLWAIPGGHATPLKSMFFRTPEMGTKFEIYDRSPWDLTRMIPLEAKKGTLIVLHSRSPHMSYANTSPKSRHAYTLHIIDANSNYPSDNWLQRPSDMSARGF